MGVFLFFLFWTAVAAAGWREPSAEVGTMDQFTRLKSGSLPTELRYDEERRWLTISPKLGQVCSFRKAFFEVYVNSKGELYKAKIGRDHAKPPAEEQLVNLLKQIRFKPLTVGGELASVHSFVNIVCEPPPEPAQDAKEPRAP